MEVLNGSAGLLLISVVLYCGSVCAIYLLGAGTNYEGLVFWNKTFSM